MILAETPEQKENREAQKDDARQAMFRWSELTGESFEYLDEFTYDPQDLARIHGFDRLPKCCKPKPLKEKK